jgi:hypothetical protein
MLMIIVISYQDEKYKLSDIYLFRLKVRAKDDKIILLNEPALPSYHERWLSSSIDCKELESSFFAFYNIVVFNLYMNRIESLIRLL